MEYRKATETDAESIQDILQTTIQTIYPKYYPQEVADSFCDLHNLNHVIEGIASGNMGVLVAGDRIVGTGCYDDNHITSVYVSPDCQGKGYGTYILDCLEDQISENHDNAVLDASLPAVILYERRGYETIGHGTIDVGNDAKLVYEIMRKPLS